MKKLIGSFTLMALVTSAYGEDLCTIGAECELNGTLRIYRTPPAFTAILDKESGCVPLALSESMFSKFKSMDDKSVAVVGIAMSNAFAKDTVTYEIGGRDVTTLCGSSPIVIFINEVVEVGE
jgi:hypothetical protein